jgi:hypothetical protein
MDLSDGKLIGTMVLGLAGLSLVALVGCGGAAAPSAELIESTPHALQLDRDEHNDVTFKLRYSDADGDLGGGRALIQDCRQAALQVVATMPAIANEEAVTRGVSISGELTLHVNDIGEVIAEELPEVCARAGVAFGPNETVFCITLVDALEHEGSTACTPPISLTASTN